MMNAEKHEDSLEMQFQKLEETIQRMESGELTLDETFSLYEQGLKQIKQCSDRLDLIEKKMLLLNHQGETVEF